MVNLKNLNKKKKNQVHPGTYVSMVVSVEDAPGYVAGEAIKISYELTSQTGKINKFSEVFWTANVTRSDEFFDYLADNGIETLDDFVGCVEEVEILRRVTNNGFAAPSIVKRTFVSRPAAPIEVTEGEANV